MPPYTARQFVHSWLNVNMDDLQHAVDDFLELGGHDDEAFDGLADVLQAGPDGLQQLVEAAHLLHEDRVHALTVRRRVLVQRRCDVEVGRQLVEYVGRHLVHQLAHETPTWFTNPSQTQPSYGGFNPTPATKPTAAAAAQAAKSCHNTPVLRSLHWLKITERIEYKLLSLTYKVLTTTQPPYLHNLIAVQPPRSTRSSSLLTLARPPTSSSLRITDRSF